MSITFLNCLGESCDCEEEIAQGNVPISLFTFRHQLPVGHIVAEYSPFYYADNLPAMRAIVVEFCGDGVLVNRTIEVSHHDLPRDLMWIAWDYTCLVVH